jgi:NAD(P)H-hydrate epimerase
MAEIDRLAQERYALPQYVLMEDAGLRAYLLARERIWSGGPPQGRVVILAGRGNNGGDALVMARQCRLEGAGELSIVLGAGEPVQGSLAATHLTSCRALGLPVLSFPEQSSEVASLLAGARWIVDGLAGTGLSGAARPPLSDLIRLANSSPGETVAVDLPSGIGDAFRPGYPAMEAEYTLTIGLPKLSLYLPLARPLAGRILVVPGVFPGELLEGPQLTGRMLLPEELDELPVLPRDAHKGRRGHLAVFAGSEGTTGAAWLAATAAARSRAGLVTLFLPRTLYAAALPRFKSVMLRPWEPASEPQLFEPRRFSGLLVGPGWGTDDQRLAWLSRLLALGLPGILDADGISLLARLEPRPRLAGRWVLTPHPGEFARLAGTELSSVLEDPLPALQRASAELEAVMVLKGACTFVVSPDGRYRILDGMNPALATGGSGDVLAGVIAGLAAGGIPVLEAACLGVLLHSRVGEQAHQERGYFLAEDLLPYISAALKGR